MPVEHSPPVPVVFVMGMLELKPGLHGGAFADGFSRAEVLLPALCYPGSMLAGTTYMLPMHTFSFPMTLLLLQPQSDLLLPSVTTEQ